MNKLNFQLDAYEPYMTADTEIGYSYTIYIDVRAIMCLYTPIITKINLKKMRNNL